MRTNFLTITALVGLFAACGGGNNNGGGTVTCGTVTCKVREVCSMSSSAPVCVCATGYQGSTCSSCAAGYAMTNGVCIMAPIDCSRTTACGGASHGTCMNNTCTCTAAYQGQGCESCADGYQDNDKNGTCLATCANPATTISCAAPKTCADTSGNPVCSCPPGSSGSSCQSCLSGYTRQSNGTCIQCPPNTTGEACAECAAGFNKQPDGSCAACPPFSTGINCDACVTGYAKDPATGKCVKSCTTNSQCGTRGYCDMSLPVPSCSCQPGYTGATCSECAPNYVRDVSNNCILAAIPSGTAFIGAAMVAGINSLVAIDPAASSVTAIRPLPNTSITQLASDVDNKVLYTLDNTGIKKLDLATGAHTAVATLASASNLTWGPGGLFSIPSISPYLLKRINVASGGIADLGTTSLASVQALAFDNPSGTLIAARWASTSPELHRVSASDGTTVPMGTLTFDPAALPPGNQRIGIASDPNTGSVYATTSVGRTPQVLFTTHCTQVAAGVGLTGYDSSTITAMEYPTNGIGVGLTKVIGSSAASGKETIAYASNAAMGATPAILRIETVNPDAFICLMTRDESIRIVLASTARFAGIVFTGNRPRLAMEIEGVREVTSPIVHIALQSETYLDSSVRAYAINKVYTTSEWTTKKLPHITSLWGSDTNAPTRLVELDLTANKPARVLSFAGVELQNMLTPWKP